MATETAKAIEAIIMVAEQPVEPQLLAQLLEISVADVEAILAELMASYEVEDRGFILTRIAGGYRYQSHPDLAPYVERFVLEGQTARLSAAALETLAIIAYKQPIARGQVASIRGVSVDGVVRTLEQRGYITEVGRDPGPGNPSLFGTTDAFLEKLGINSLEDLPPIAAFVPGPDVVEQLEHGLRAEIDADLAAELARDVAAAAEAAETAGTAGTAGEDETAETAPMAETAEAETDREASPEADAQTADATAEPAGDPTDGADESIDEVDTASTTAGEALDDEVVDAEVVADAPDDAEMVEAVLEDDDAVDEDAADDDVVEDDRSDTDATGATDDEPRDEELVEPDPGTDDAPGSPAP